jgi:hypothetical protein
LDCAYTAKLLVTNNVDIAKATYKVIIILIGNILASTLISDLLLLVLNIYYINC